MVTPLLDHEVLKMKDSNFFALCAYTLRDFGTITYKKCRNFLEGEGATIHIEEDSSERVMFKFRSERVLSCSGTLSFKQGKLSSYSYAAKPQGYFKMRVCRKVYQQLVETLGQICEMTGGKIEEGSNPSVQTKMEIEGKTLTLTCMKNPFTGTPMVTVQCDLRKP